MKLHVEPLWLLLRAFAMMLAAPALARGAANFQPEVRWAITAGSESYDLVGGMALSPSGVLFLAGSFDAANSSKPEMVLFRFDSTGAPLEGQPSRGEEIRGVTVDAAGNYFLTGRVWSPERLGQGKLNDLYLGKFSSTGRLLWERALGSSGVEARRVAEGGYDVALDGDGNIFVVGSSSGAATFGDMTFPNTPGGPLLCKFDPNGQLLWAKRAEGQPQIFQGQILGSGVGNHLALDQQGNVILTGYLFNGSTDFDGEVVKVAGPNDADFFIAKFSPTGEVQWVQVGYGYGGLAVDRRGNIYFNGYVAGDSSMHCGALAPTGAIIWERIIPGAFGAGVALTAAGDPVFVGEFEGTVDLDGHTVEAVADTNQKFLICSASFDGQFRWVIGDSGLALSRASRVVTSGDGGIFVTGDVRCIWRGDWICEPGQLDSFALLPQEGGVTELFIARIDVPPPQAIPLSIQRNDLKLSLSWPTAATGFILQSADSLTKATWTTVSKAPLLEAGQNVVTVEAGSSAQFFRLTKP